MPTPSQVQQIEVDRLRFDRLNPRLLETDLAPDADEIEIAKALWQHLQAEEIVMSIVAANEFFPHEPLMVEERSDDAFTVIEGNRRLLAVRTIIDPELRRHVGADGFEAFSSVTKALQSSLKKLPCIVTKRRDLWQFLGFKHVNGAKPWGSLGKAEFIAHVHEDYKEPLPEIARQIGDRHTTVQRLYRGWCVVRQAENEKVFDRRNRSKNRFAFSHLYTGLEYPNIQAFLGITDEDYEKRKPVPPAKSPELGELMLWLFGSREPEIAPLIRSQNPDLSHLATALGKTAGVKALRARLSLLAARDASLGDERLFDDAMLRAIAALKDANAVCRTGATGGADEMEIAQQAYKLAGAVVDELEDKQSGRRRRGDRGRSKDVDS